MPGRCVQRRSRTCCSRPDLQTDIVHVIRGVIAAESGAIEFYTRIVEETDQIDPVPTTW